MTIWLGANWDEALRDTFELRRELQRAFAGNARLLQRLLQPRDFGIADFYQRWSHDSFIETAKKDERFFHAVVHIEERWRVEDLR